MSTNTNTQLMTLDVDGLTKREQELLGDILNDVSLSVKRLHQAAVKWMEMAEASREKIVAGSPGSLKDFWVKLTRVGSGALHPQLATVGGKAATLLGKLSIEEQEMYLRERMPLVVRKGRAFDLLRVDVAELNEEQRKQVFRENDDGTVVVRSEEEQQVYFAKKKAGILVREAALGALKTVDRGGWRVERGRVWVKPQIVKDGITRKELLVMLRDLGD